MTRHAFLRAYVSALPQLDAELLLHAEGLYPTGDLIRVKVRVPQGVVLPPLLAPAGLVWYARTGQFKSILEDQSLALALGLEVGDALDLCLAADKPLEKLTYEQRRWRVGLLEAVETLRIHT